VHHQLQQLGDLGLEWVVSWGACRRQRSWALPWMEMVPDEMNDTPCSNRAAAGRRPRSTNHKRKTWRPVNRSQAAARRGRPLTGATMIARFVAIRGRPLLTKLTFSHLS